MNCKLGRSTSTCRSAVRMGSAGTPNPAPIPPPPPCGSRTSSNSGSSPVRKQTGATRRGKRGARRIVRDRNQGRIQRGRAAGVPPVPCVVGSLAESMTHEPVPVEGIPPMTAAAGAQPPEPTDALGFAERGADRLEAGQYEGALADLTEAIRRDPELVAAYGFRGQVFLKQGALD